MTKQNFTTLIAQSGRKVFLTLPFDPNEVWGSKQRHYVTGMVNDFAIRGLIGLEGDAYQLSLGEAWRRDTGLMVGMQVKVELAPEGPQASSIAADIAQALEAEPEARAFFDQLPTFYRKNYLRWIDSAKRPETRSARITEMASLLKAGKREK